MLKFIKNIFTKFKSGFKKFKSSFTNWIKKTFTKFKSSFTNWIKRTFTKIKNAFTKYDNDHRVIFRLIILIAIGSFSGFLVLNGFFHRILSWDTSGIYLFKQTITSLNKLFSNTHIIILVLSLPILFLLWIFRTHDTNQNRKNDEANLSANSFFNSLNLLTKNDPLSKQIAIKRLMYLRDNKLYPKEEIELVINKSKLDLHNTNLSGVNLSGLDLTEVNLMNADLKGVDLRGTYLRNVNLIRADLRDAKLEGADLMGANYNYKTIFPNGFNLQTRRMIEVD